MTNKYFLKITLLLSFLALVLGQGTKIATEVSGANMNSWSIAPAVPQAGIEKRQTTTYPGTPVDLSQEQIDIILREHNSLRSSLTQPAPLKGLATFTWDSNLANIWKNHPNQCQFAHTTNQWRSDQYADATNAPDYPATYVGENLAWYAQFQKCKPPGRREDCEKVLTYNLNNLLYGWGAEKSCYTYSKVGSDVCNKTCTDQLYSNGCGHYTQQIWEDTTRVGCVVLNCTEYDLTSSNYGFTLACNYASGGNYWGSYPYTSNVAGSKRAEDEVNETRAVKELEVNKVEPIRKVATEVDAAQRRQPQPIRRM